MSADVVDVEYDCGCLTGRNVMTGRAFVTHCAAHRAEPQEAADARAERAEAERRAMESRWATSLDLLSERTARLWKAEDENARLRAALAQERPELRTLDDGTDAGGYIVPPFGAIADAVSAEIRRQAGTE